jgi:hypothetical protein
LQVQRKNNIIFKLISSYLSAEKTAARPITERAQKNKENTQIQTTYENTEKNINNITVTEKQGSMEGCTPYHGSTQCYTCLFFHVGILNHFYEAMLQTVKNRNVL